MTSIRVECVRDITTLESLRKDFDRLSGGIAMRRLSWLVAWWKAYHASYQLHVLVAFRNDTVCGIMPLAEITSTLTGRLLVFMGSGKVCTDDCGILVEPIDAKETAESFATWIVQSPDCCRWDHLNFDGVRENNYAMACFADQIQRLTNMPIDRKLSPNCWSVPLEGGLDAYRSRLSKRVRKIFREAEASLDSNIGTLDIAQSQDQAMEFARQIERMHQARWQKRGIDGCFSSQEFTHFVDGAITEMWQDPFFIDKTTDNSKGDAVPPNAKRIGKQRVLVGLLRISGIVASGAICFRDRSAIAMYLVGMNPEKADDRPGWMLNTAFIRYAIEQGCSEFDFLRGDEAYKERLGGVPTVQHRWVVPSKRWTSQARNLAYQTAAGLKAWWNDKNSVIPLPLTLLDSK